MPNWTIEQQRAINESGQNIIVSAGAGSGKTAVLTERVITKLKSGINIQNLLILTFTNAAATEMKDRIRKAISKDPILKSQLDYIDSSYITTFDSFSISIVRKYHYLLNVSPKISIVEKTICDMIRKKIIDTIFDENYETKENNFIKLINDFCVKDDSNVKKGIIDINEKLDRLINKNEYLNNYINVYYSENNIDKLIKSYEDNMLEKISFINIRLTELSSYCNNDYYEKVYASLCSLIKAKCYNEVVNTIEVKLPIVPRNSCDELKNIKKLISDKIKELKKSLIYKDENHIKDTLLSTKSYAQAIINIVIELDKRLKNYKNENDEYEFNDIAKMAIELVKKHDDVREELKNTFNEIMLDEYQDTSDIQEELISLISNNNVYMVGDIKQSIYRFRNANPTIFKNKYNDYSNNIGGLRIDLLNNFRSRREVLDDINDIFNLVMTDSFGGADYKTSHQMNFGNNIYTENKTSQNMNLEIYNYERSNKKYKNSEYEAFIIANDIKEKIKNNYQVVDKISNKLRNARYDDFCILIDRKGNFELYKKIFEYLGIPLVIYYDEKITNEKDLLIIKNIINIIIKIYNKEFDKKFKYDFYSIYRSYLYNVDDESYLEYFINNDFKNSELYKKCENISEKINSYSNSELIVEIVNEFDFYENVIKVGDIEKFIVRIDYLKYLGDSLSKLGYSIIEFSDYLNDMVINDSDISFSLNAKVPNNVKLMNIHKSKGLEFPICYFSGYTNKYNRMDLNDKISFDKDLGFILPFYDDGIGNTIVKELYKTKYNQEDISERIRLFYVSLTRAKEKMIIVTSLSKDEIILNDDVKSSYNSFLSIIESIKSNIENRILNIDDINLTKSYNNINKMINIEKSDFKINVKEIHIENSELEQKHASKEINKLLTTDELKKLEYGAEVHKILEENNFYGSKIDIINNLVSKIGDISTAKIYKEHEFITVTDNKEFHGIIDLLLEYPDYIKIIDYKLKNINDKKYTEQLKIYKEYVSKKINKKVYTYLYSILDNELLEIETD